MIDSDEPEVCLQGGLPIDRQIYEQLRACILACRLHPGEQLPSQRGLAVELAINPEAVQRAYDRLEQDGLISTADSSGARVTMAGLAVADPVERRRLLEQCCAEFLTQAGRLGFTPEEALAVAATWHPRSMSSW